MNNNTQIAYFAAGCFWGVEESFQKMYGVVETRVGYSGGHVEHPTYEQVCKGGTAHSETVEVVFDPENISYRELVQIFFAIHDPTTPNRQGADIGTQYRSALFYLDSIQKETAEEIKESLQKTREYQNIVTNIESFTAFYPAEEYHQKYIQKKSGTA